MQYTSAIPIPIAPPLPAPAAFGRWQARLWQRLLLITMRGLTGSIQSLSDRASNRFGSSLGDLGFRFAKKHRRRTCANFRLAYGEALTAAERESLARRVFRHFGRGIISFLRAPRWSEAELSRRVRCEGWEHVAAARAAGKGVLFATAHLGNWEVLGRWLALIQRLPITVVARDPENPAFAAYVRKMREGAGFTVLDRGRSARGLLQALRRDECIIILADQSSGGIFTPFFGVPAGTVTGPAAIALHSGAALIPIFCLVNADGTFAVRCLPPITSPASGDREADTQAMMAEYNRVLESAIRENPEQWLWMHNRWKASFEEKHRCSAWGEDTSGEAASAARLRWQI